MPSLDLPSHCALRPETAGWWRWSGYTHVLWIEDGAATDRPPGVGDLATAYVQAPFATDEEGRFCALWLPWDAAINGWDIGAAPLSCVVIVEAQLSLVRGARRFGGQDCVEIGAQILAVHALPDLRAEPGVPTDLQGCNLNPRGRNEKAVSTDERLVLIATSVQGDIHFEFFLLRGQPSILMVTDESICAGFFYAGHGLVSANAMAALMEPSPGNGAERLAELGAVSRGT